MQRGSEMRCDGRLNDAAMSISPSGDAAMSSERAAWMLLAGILLVALMVVALVPSVAEAKRPSRVRGHTNEIALRSVLKRYQPTLQHCFLRSGEQGRGAVRLDASIAVSRQGHVKTVSIESKAGSYLTTCVENHIRRWNFPAVKKPHEYRFPVVFRS